MVAEEADARTRAANKVIEADRLTRPVEATPVPGEHHARGRVVREEHVDPLAPEQRVDVLPRVVMLTH